MAVIVLMACVCMASVALKEGGGAHAPGAPPTSATYDTVRATYMQNS